MAKVETKLFFGIAALAVAAVAFLLVFAGGEFFQKGSEVDPPRPTERKAREKPSRDEPRPRAPEEADRGESRVERPEEGVSRVQPKPRSKMIGGETGSVIGVVTNQDGRPVPDARVLLRPQNRSLKGVRVPEEKGGYETDTDDSGIFEIAEVAPGARYLLTVRHPQYAEKTYRGRIVVKQGREVEIPTLVLGKGSTLGGIVQEQGGGTIPGARVVLASGHFLGIDIHGDHQYATSTDDRGHFAFGNVSEGKKRVYAWAEGYALQVTDPIDLAGGVVLDSLLLELIPGVSLRGKVISANGGEAIPGAKVYAMPSRANVMARGTAESDENGEFTIADLTGDPFFLTADAKGFTRSKKLLATPGTGEVTIEVAPNASVRGRVIDAVTRNPIQKFSVAAKRSKAAPMVGLSRERKIEDENGEFVLQDIEPERYVVIVRSEGYAPKRSEEFRAVSGTEAGPIVVELDSGSYMEGFVLAQDGGLPVAEAKIDVRPSRGNSNVIFDVRRGRRRTNSRTLSARDGSYRIENMAPGTYDVTIEHPEFARMSVMRVEVPAGGSPVEVDPAYLTKGGSVAGMVRKKDGTPDKRARVSLSTTGYQRNANADREGRYRFDHVPAGSYKLSVVTRSGEPDLGGLFDLDAQDVEVIEGEVVNVDL